MPKWIRAPGPGQIRGEGDWVRVRDDGEHPDAADYEYCLTTGYLPVHEGDEPPET